MTAFDTDILSDLGDRVPGVVSRAQLIPVDQQFVPIIAAEEAVRGQLANVRAAQSKPGPAALVRAYAFLDETLGLLRQFKTLPYTLRADALFQQWRSQKVRVGSNDLRIAAIAVAHGATLVTRNARDFAQVPGLALDVWS